MRICIHYNGKTRWAQREGPPSVSELERLATDLFHLHNTRFILCYLDEDESHVVLIEPEDLQLCRQTSPLQNFELNVVSAETGLFQPRNIEIVKRMFLRELRQRAKEGGESFFLQEELDLIGIYLRQFIHDANYLANILEFLRNSIEMQAIEAELGLDAEAGGFPAAGEANGLGAMESQRQDQLSVSSIPEKENSAKSFFTDASTDELKKIGLGRAKLPYVNRLSEIPEDNCSMLSNLSDEDERNSPIDREAPPQATPLDPWQQDLRISLPDPGERMSDALKLKDAVDAPAPAFASEITRKTDSKKDKNKGFRIFSRLKRLYESVKNGLS